MNKHSKTVLVVFALAGAAWLAWPNDPAAAIVTAKSSSPGSSPSADQASTSVRPAADWPPAWPYADPEPVRVPLPVINQSVSAAQSMAQTRVNGDPDMPPILRDQEPAPVPTQAELSDPKAYQAFEARQTTRLYRAYNQAAAAALPKLREDIERGRTSGISAEKIAKAEAKVRGIEEMRDKLMKDHPELAL